jgi:hypothetical protein
LATSAIPTNILKASRLVNNIFPILVFLALPIILVFIIQNKLIEMKAHTSGIVSHSNAIQVDSSEFPPDKLESKH